MAIFPTITQQELESVGVVGLPDTPSMTARAMQEKFEETARSLLAPKFNALAAQLEGPGGAAVGAAVPEGLPSGTPATVQGVLNGLNEARKAHTARQDNPHAVTAQQTGAYTRQETEQAIDRRVLEIGAGDMARAEYDPNGRRQDVYAYADGVGVHVYTHQKVGTVHRLTGSGACGRVKLTANVAAGDTVQVNGKTVPAYVGGEAFADALAGESLRGRWLSFVWDGTQVNFKAGGGLSNTKLALADAAASDVVEGKTFYAGNDKSLKTGAILTRNQVGKNGAVGISQYYPSAPVTPVAANTQTNQNMDGVNRFCLQPPAGTYDGNSYVGETYDRVSAAIGLTAEKLMYGQQVLGITGTGVTRAIWHGSLPTDYNAHTLGTAPASGTVLLLFAGSADHDMQIASIAIGGQVVATPGRNNLYVGTFPVSSGQSIVVQWSSNFGGGTPSGQGVVCYV